MLLAMAEPFRVGRHAALAPPLKGMDTPISTGPPRAVSDVDSSVMSVQLAMLPCWRPTKLSNTTVCALLLDG